MIEIAIKYSYSFSASSLNLRKFSQFSVLFLNNESKFKTLARRQQLMPTLSWSEPYNRVLIRRDPLSSFSAFIRSPSCCIITSAKLYATFATISPSWRTTDDGRRMEATIIPAWTQLIVTLCHNNLVSNNTPLDSTDCIEQSGFE
jgi:hypothetical protein